MVVLTVAYSSSTDKTTTAWEVLHDDDDDDARSGDEYETMLTLDDLLLVVQL